MTITRRRKRYDRNGRRILDTGERFYVATLSGFPLDQDRNSRRSVPPKLFQVHDRANSHRVIARFDETYGKAEKRRQDSLRTARELNLADREETGQAPLAVSSHARPAGSSGSVASRSKSRRPTHSQVDSEVASNHRSED